MTDKKPISDVEITDEEVDGLIANYSAPIDPEKKAALLAKLEAERPAFEKNRSEQEAHAEEQEKDLEL